MIEYDRGGWFTLLKISLDGRNGRFRGSAAVRGIIMALISASVATILSHYKIPTCLFEEGPDHKKTCGLVHPNVFTWYFQISTFMLTFHSNMAYNRYWEARTQLQTMTSNLGLAASRSVIFCSTSKLEITCDVAESQTQKDKTAAIEKGKRLAIYQAKLIHLYSLLNAVMTQYLLNDAYDTELSVMGGTTQIELEELSRSGDQVALVESWLTEVLCIGFYSTHKATLIDVPPPVVSRVWQDLSSSLNAFHQACKIEDTPFPYPYQQLIAIFVITTNLCVPIIVAEFTYNAVYSFMMTFLIVWAYNSIYAAAAKMESPFGSRPNDLPLKAIHNDFNVTLAGLYDGDTYASLEELITFGTAHLVSNVADAPIPFMNRREHHGTDLGDTLYEDRSWKSRIPCWRIWGPDAVTEDVCEYSQTGFHGGDTSEDTTWIDGTESNAGTLVTTTTHLGNADNISLNPMIIAQQNISGATDSALPLQRKKTLNRKRV